MQLKLNFYEVKSVVELEGKGKARPQNKEPKGKQNA
jgi:hypothetical protein